jgi:hypothetical protein
VLDPVPPSSRRTKLLGRDPRLLQAKLAERALAYLAPDFFAIHPVEAESPEEEVMLLDYTFLSTVPEATLRVPSFSSWLEDQDQGPAYRYLRRLLKLLAWKQEGRRFVLKTPHHLEWFDTLLDGVPGREDRADAPRPAADHRVVLQHGHARPRGVQRPSGPARGGARLDQQGGAHDHARDRGA